MSYFLLYGAFALWVLFDGVTRKMGASTALWVIGTVLFGPIILPIYLASRPLKQGEVREGGRAWNILKNFAILWTIVMAIATVAALMNVSDVTKGLTSGAERIGAGVGMLLGMALLGALWFFPTTAAALMAFLLKKNTIVETGPTGPLVGQLSTAGVAGGWGGLIGFAILGLIAVAIANVAARARKPESITSGSSDTKTTRSSYAPTPEWALVESADKMDKTPIVILSKAGSSGASITIRCDKGKTAAYVNTNAILDNGSVRVKFDESMPSRQTWGKSTDDTALFAPDAVTFARQLTKTRMFLLEFTPFHEGARTISFDVTNLGVNLNKISDACNWEEVDRGRARVAAAGAALRARLIRYVHPCERQDLGKWCWSDPNDSVMHDDSGYKNTKEEALNDAMTWARQGLAFKNQSDFDNSCVVGTAQRRSKLRTGLETFRRWNGF